MQISCRQPLLRLCREILSRTPVEEILSKKSCRRNPVEEILSEKSCPSPVVSVSRCMRYSTSSKNSTSSKVFHCHFLFKRLPLPLLLQASVASESFHFLETRLLHASRLALHVVRSKNSTSSKVFHCHFLFKRLPLPLLLQASVASESFHFLETRLLHASRLALHVVRFPLRASSSVHF